MTKLLIGLIAIFAIGTNVGNTETLINIEEAAEVSSLNLRLDGGATSRIYARMCDDCELLSLLADSKTVIKRGRTRLSLVQAADLKGKGATILFNPTTLRVTRIIFWN